MMRRTTSRGRDSGAVMIVTAVLLSFALLTLTAIVINDGDWFSEKGQVQNGADAAALAIAQVCGSNPSDTTTCSSSLSNPAAVSYANQNANDGASTVSLICGNAPDSSGANRLAPCTASPNPCPGCVGGTNYLCPAGSGDYVNVQVASSPALAADLGSFVTSNQSKTIGSCSQVRWGAPTSCGNCVAFTISACEWAQDTNDGQTFAKLPSQNNGAYPNSYLSTIATRRTMPVYDSTPGDDSTNVFLSVSSDPATPARSNSPYGAETVLTLKGFGGNKCGKGNGQDYPGRFGWLSPSSCGMPQLSVGGTYTGNGGVGVPDCESIFTNSRNTQTPIYIPVFSSTSNNSYTLAGFAAFVVTGWNSLKESNTGFNNPTVKSIITLNDTALTSAARGSESQYVCTSGAGNCQPTSPPDYVPGSLKNDQAVYGYFVEGLIPASSLPSGTCNSNDCQFGGSTTYLAG